MRVHGIGKTDTGNIRSKNEDSIFISNEPLGPMPNLYIVSDGMGGHLAGEIASTKGIEFFLNYIKENNCQTEMLDYMVLALSFANRQVYELSVLDAELTGMGATFTACAIKDGTLHIVHAGDSRVYSLNDSGINQLTTDHTYVHEMIKAGQITERQAKKHPQRNIITKALGTEDELFADKKQLLIEGKNTILLCSDGLTNMVSDDQIYSTVKNSQDIQGAVDALVSLANQHGGDDNISVILIETEG